MDGHIALDGAGNGAEMKAAIHRFMEAVAVEASKCEGVVLKGGGALFLAYGLNRQRVVGEDEFSPPL